MNLDLLLLDLDETLLPTELLRDARHCRDPIDLTGVIGYDAIRLHDGVAESLNELAGLTRVGLVTSSPRWYVDQLLADHLPAYEWDVQITYNDVDHLKPHPEPLHRALSRAGVVPQRAIYVGDADLDFDACAAAGLDFVGAGWADHPTFPAAALCVQTPQALVELIGGRG